MKKVINLLASLMLMCWALNAWSFDCITAGGASIPIGGGSANVYVTLNPSINIGKNLVVDLSTQIFCKNLIPATFDDYVSLERGSAYGGLLSSFTGSVKYNGSFYPFPLNNETSSRLYDSTNYEPWPTLLYLTPISTAGGVVITSGSLIAILILHQRNNFGSSDEYIWNVYANNDVVVPTGGCDVSSRNVTVTLPDYPGSMAAPVNVRCAQNQNISYYLSGSTVDSTNSIFRNTASTSPAQGIGVQMKRNGSVVSANRMIPLGNVGTSPIDLGLTATYALSSGKVTAGNVQSIIGVTFVYQ